MLWWWVLGSRGLNTGRLLAQRGLQVLMVERRRSLSTGVRTTGIFVRRTLDDFGLPEHLLGPGVRDVLLYPPSRRAPIRFTSDRDEYRVADMPGVYQHARCTAESAGAEVHLGVRYAGLSNGVVQFEGADPVTARFIVGADGPRSRVAADLGLKQNRRFLVGAEIVHPTASGASEPAFHCVLDPRVAPGYLGWVIDDGHSAHVGIAGYPQAMRTGVRPLLDAFAADAPGRAAATGPIERRGGLIPVGGVLRRLTSPIGRLPGLLVGDAAGAVSPLTAGGLDPCLRMSELAAAVIAEYLCDGDDLALRRYDGRRLRTWFRGRLLLRRSLARVRSAAAAETAVATLRSRAGRKAATRILFGDASFPDLH